MTDPRDKCPSGTGRRRFVKSVVAGPALAGDGTTASGMATATTDPAGVGCGTREYAGIEHVAGPAPRTMPQISVRLDDEGYLRGLWGEVMAKSEGGETYTVAEWEPPGPGWGSRPWPPGGRKGAPVEPDALPGHPKPTRRGGRRSMAVC